MLSLILVNFHLFIYKKSIMCGIPLDFLFLIDFLYFRILIVKDNSVFTVFNFFLNFFFYAPRNKINMIM